MIAFREAAGGGTTTLTAAQGSAAITGQAAKLLWHQAIKTVQGTVAITGQAARLNWHQTIKAEQGAVAIAGQAATLTYTPTALVYTLTAEQGSVAITGQAANLQWSQALKAEQGAVAITGQAANLNWHQAIKAVQGSAAITGQAARLQWHHTLKAEQGAVAITGQAATLTYIGGAPGVYTMTADQAGVSITGQAARLQKTWSLKCNSAQITAYVSIGAPIVGLPLDRLYWHHALKAEQGAAAIIGQAARIQWHHKMKAEQASVAVTTQAAPLTWNRLLKASAASLAITGSDIDFYASRLLRAEQATIAITGHDATLTYSGAPVLVAPAERTVKVAAESRLITIPSETACTVTVGAELVTNGDMAFDANWTNSPVNPYDNFYHDWFFQAFFGNHAAATLAQAYSDPFSVTAGQTYRVTFSIFVITAPGPKIILAKDTSGTSIVPGVYQSWSGAEWQDHVVYFTPTESSATARFFLYNQEATDFRIDDVSVKPYDVDLIAGAESGDFRGIKVAAENRTMII